jgi:dolichol-phosphate hexosyltransferase
MKSSASSLPTGTSTITANPEVFIDKRDVTVVVPTLNEEEAIGLVLKGLQMEGYSNLLVVDGNSVDDTVKIAKTMNVRVLSQKGAGKTGAIKTAIEYASTPYLAVIDGDCTYSPSDIEILLERAKSSMQVIGLRRDTEHITILNRFGNKMINVLFNLSFGAKLSDVCSGLYVLNTSFAKSLVLDTGGYEVEVEIAAHSVKANSVAELPVSYSKRVGIKKLNPIRDGFKIILSILNLAQKYNPLIFYWNIIGALFTFFGLSATILDVILGSNGRIFPVLPNISLLSTLIGIQLVMLSIIVSQITFLRKTL